MYDYLDIDLDRSSKAAKTIVRGDIRPRTALLMSCAAGAAGAGLSALFGWKTLFFALLMLASGMVYDFWAKGTVYSWTPYAIAVPALPIWSSFAAGKFRPAILLAFPLGALTALALNLANTLPDLAGDVRYGIRGLPHRLGQTGSLIVTWCSFAGVLALLVSAPYLFGNDPRRLFPGIAAGGIILLIMIVDYAATRSYASLTRGWYLSLFLVVFLGIMWIASLPSD
jgi:4-hydroxybenzoate polyprenyltransferase